jgi:RNase P/RNase MRP subunit POP5
MELSPIATVLDMCQRTQHAHKKSMETLSTTYVKLAGDGNGSLTPFLDEFVEHTKRVLVVFKREQAVERVVDFMCKFASRYEPVAIAVLKVSGMPPET